MNYCTLLITMLLLFNGMMYGKRTTSLVIPCCASHAQHLLPLLRMYEQQTELPDDVVISLSQSQDVPLHIFAKLQEELWCFPVKLLLFKEKLFAGENRNNACQEARGDILVCQDADDIPHPQRIATINYFFKKYKIDHLIHQMVGLDPGGMYKQNPRITCITLNEDATIPFETFSHIPFFFPENFDDVWEPGMYTNGNVAITRRVFDTIKWSNAPRGQDTIFNREVYEAFKQCIAIQVPLYVARPFLSSHEGTNGTYLLNYPVYSFSDREKQYRITIVEN